MQHRNNALAACNTELCTQLADRADSRRRPRSGRQRKQAALYIVGSSRTGAPGSSRQTGRCKTFRYYKRIVYFCLSYSGRILPDFIKKDLCSASGWNKLLHIYPDVLYIIISYPRQYFHKKETICRSFVFIMVFRLVESGFWAAPNLAARLMLSFWE